MLIAVMTNGQVQMKGYISTSSVDSLQDVDCEPSPDKEQLQKQDKSSDIEQQPPFGDCKISNIQPQNKGGGGVTKPTEISCNFDKV